MSESPLGEADSPTNQSDKSVCPECGREFDTERGKNIHLSTGHGKRYQDKEWLEEAYEDNTQKEIAEMCDTDRVVILRWMDRLDVETENHADPTRPVNHQFFNRPNRPIGNEYERVRTTVDGKLYTVKVHRLIAVAHGKLDPEELFNRDIAVHHKSGHGLDNRPDNIEVMGHGDHTSLHNEERKSG